MNRQKSESHVGKTYGSLTILEVTRWDAGRNAYALARCCCGLVVEKRLQHITKGSTVSCGCVTGRNPRRKPEADIGSNFGRLTVIESVGRDGKGKPLVKVRCRCGKTVIKILSQIRSGNVRSCGCLKRGRKKKTQAAPEPTPEPLPVPMEKLIISRMRSRAWKVFRVIAWMKSGRTDRDFGCSLNELASHLEGMFTDGMTWENYGSAWHVDHIDPVCSFDHLNQEHISECWSYLNLRPLSKEENRAKIPSDRSRSIRTGKKPKAD